MSTHSRIELGTIGANQPPELNDAQSDEGSGDYQPMTSLLGRHVTQKEGLWKGLLKDGGLGEYLFHTSTGWHVWLGILVFWTGGCGFGLLLMNRFIMLTGIYKIPWPLSHTHAQLVLTHIILVTWSTLTRWLGPSLRRLGCAAAIAPSGSNALIPPARSKHTSWLRWSDGFTGIAGGGIFEFDIRIVKQVLPLAAVFVAKVLLSNYSFAYTTLPVYQIIRIGTIPVAILLCSTLGSNSYSVTTLCSAFITTLYLLAALLQFPLMHVIWESIVAGLVSSVFAAVYPFLLLRVYGAITADLIPQAAAIIGKVSSEVETRAYYRTLHYFSLLSVMILTPLVLISGELVYIYQNIPFLDVPFFLLMIWCGALGSFAVFTSTLLLVKATSPLTTLFVNVPRSAFQLAIINMFKIPKHSWDGILLCWLGSLWYLYLRWSEGRLGFKRRRGTR